MIKAVVNRKEFQIQSTQEGLLVNGEPFAWDIVKLSESSFHILYQHRSYRAEVVSVEPETKTILLKINNRKHLVTVKDKLDVLLETMGIDSQASGKLNTIKAPMPGLIIDLKIKSGDSVNEGDQLLILEAMKMENVIKSPGKGTVKTVKIKKGDSVEKGQVLIEF